MFKTAARFLLLRVLPRRLIPIVTVVEAVMLIRSVRKRSRVRVNEPVASRTAPPEPLVTTTTDDPRTTTAAT
jgi:hypothetical protein